MTAPEAEASTVIALTERWLTRVVIGLNLCPFAKAVQSKGQVRYLVSAAQNVAALRDDLASALRDLQASTPEAVDTTLLIHPHVLQDFYDYNDFLSEADDLLVELGLEGVLQVASFHPGYSFSDSSSDDPANYTNRSPYPMLHLLREASVTRAIESFPDTSAIYERNVRTLRELPPPILARLFSDEE